MYDRLSIILNDTVFKMLRKRLPVQNNFYCIRQNEKVAFFKKKLTFLFQANVILFFVTKIVINITLKIEKGSL